MLRRLKLKHWITAASLGFIAVALAQQSEQLRRIQLDAAAWGWLFLGFLLTGVSILVNGWAWRQVLLWLGHPPKDIAVVTLFVRSNLLKYSPRRDLASGGTGAGVASADRCRACPGRCDPGSAVDRGCRFVAAELRWLAARFAAGGSSSAAAVDGAPRQGTHPASTGAGESAAVGGGWHRPTGAGGRSPRRWPLATLLIELVFVLVRFAGFACCLNAFDLFPHTATLWLAAFAMAYAIGLVVPGAPGGLGVFETTLLLRLGDGVAEAPLLAAVLSYRLISTVADGVLAGAMAVQERWVQAQPTGT